MRTRGSLAPRNAGGLAGDGWVGGMEGPWESQQGRRGTSCGWRGQGGKGRTTRRWPEMCLCLGDNLGWPKQSPGSCDAWNHAGAACQEGRQGGRNAAGEHQRRERKTLGCDCFPLPMGPSNPALVCRINRKGSKARGMLQGRDPTLRPHSSLSPRMCRAQRMGGEGQG